MKAKSMRMLSVLFLLMAFLAATPWQAHSFFSPAGFAVGLAMPNPILDLLDTILDPILGYIDDILFMPSPNYDWPPSGFWFRPDTDIDQLKQDYGNCRESESVQPPYREEVYPLPCPVSSCMIEKGYDWVPSGTGFWDKSEASIEQLQQDYTQCKGKHERPCMKEKGYTWK